MTTIWSLARGGAADKSFVAHHDAHDGNRRCHVREFSGGGNPIDTLCRPTFICSIKTPTYREIAKACGHNSSTVSRALAGNSRIPEETRARIRAVAEKMGWKPNPLASAFMAHLRSTQEPSYKATIAFLISFKNVERFEDLPEYHREVHAGASAVARASGYSLQPVWLREVDFKFTRLNRLLRSRGILGVIAHGGDMPDGSFTSLDWAEFASATWGFSILTPQLHRAACNLIHGIRLALRKTREYGYRKIAMMISPMQDKLADQSLHAAFLYEATYCGPHIWLKSYNITYDNRAARGKVVDWIQENKPDAIIGEQLVWEVLQDMGWKVPEDVAFISLYWSRAWSHIGGVDQVPYTIGVNAFDLIATQLLRNERGIPKSPKLVLNEGTWVDGASVPARKTRA